MKTIKKENLEDKYQKKIFGSTQVSKRKILEKSLLINKDTYRYKINRFSNSIGSNSNNLKNIKNDES